MNKLFLNRDRLFSVGICKYKLGYISFAQFVYFLKEMCLLLNF